MVNYANAKLYTIRSLSQPDLVYIGSTTQPLFRRFCGHKSKYKGWLLGGKNRQTTSFKILACGDAYIELLKPAPCMSKEELMMIEGEAIRSMNCVNITGKGRAGGLSQSEYDKVYGSTLSQCECGSTHTKAQTKRHHMSKKHMRWQSLYDFIMS